MIPLLKVNPTLTLIEVAAAIGKSVSAVERASVKLVKEGRLKHVGPARGGHWEVLFPEILAEADNGLGAFQKTKGKTPVKTPVKILQLLKVNPTLTLIEVAAAIGKSVSAVERASVKLVKEGRLKHVGPARGGHWEVLK